MLCFRVAVNGKPLTTAGVADFGVLSAILTWTRRPDDETSAKPELSLNVGGSVRRDFREHLTWCHTRIHTGDVLTVEVREDVEPDTPRERHFDEDAGLGEVARLRRQKERLESLLAEVEEELKSRGEP